MFVKLKKEFKLLSWQKCYNNLLRLQKRIFKSVLVGDLISAYKLQNLLLCSNSGRLLAIRLITQLNKDSILGDINQDYFFSFTERFYLNSVLKRDVFTWKPKSFGNFVYFSQEGYSIEVKLPCLIDRCWQVLVQFALEPAHQSSFSPRSLDITSSFSYSRLQYLIFLNLQHSSFGYQKRILIANFSKCLSVFNLNILMRKIISCKNLKVSLFFTFLSGFNFTSVLFPELERYFPLPFFLLSILFHGLEYFNDSIRCGTKVLIFLLPSHNESVIVRNLFKFVSNIGLDVLKGSYEIYSVFSGFDFLSWNFKIINKSCIIRPSFDSFNSFFKRVKNIITNSNYGAVWFFNLL